MELAHDREHLEHALGDFRALAPFLSAKRNLCHLLPGTEAVIRVATGEAALSELAVDAAPKVRLQMRTRDPSVLVDGEVCRRQEGRRNTAQPEAAFAISS
jgi:hypothetical protein